MDRIRCFWLEPTTLVRRYLRRYVWSEFTTTGSGKCSASGMGYHNADLHIDDVEDPGRTMSGGDLWPHTDQRWPKTCACGYQFQDGDQWQLDCSPLYRKADTGELFTLRDAPVGAMWNASWYADRHFGEYVGPDGRSLVVVTPGGEWMLDSRCSNCDSPCAHCGVAYKDHDDGACKAYLDARPHKCWCRHGEPPDLTVDKNGVTCGAGAGSIMAGSYHGFLRGGYLEKC